MPWGHQHNTAQGPWGDLPPPKIREILGGGVGCVRVGLFTGAQAVITPLAASTMEPLELWDVCSLGYSFGRAFKQTSKEDSR